jgi:hypothetical protein
MSCLAERCARKIAQDETPLVVEQFPSNGDSAASIGFERSQQTHSTVFLPPEHTNECFLHSCPHCPVTQATMLSDV